MTSFFVFGGSLPLNVLEDELVDVDGIEIEDCVLDKDFEFDVSVEDVEFSS